MLSLSHAQLIYSPTKPPKGLYGHPSVSQMETGGEVTWPRSRPKPGSLGLTLSPLLPGRLETSVGGGPWRCPSYLLFPDVSFSQVQPSITEEALGQRSQEQREFYVL